MHQANGLRVNGRRVAIVAGVRTPFARSGTALKSISAIDLGRLCVAELVQRTGIAGSDVDLLVFGTVVPSVLAPNIAREVSLIPHLPKGVQAAWRRKLQATYRHPSYRDAKRALLALHRELLVENESAAASLLEGLEETLTLHRLDVFPELGASFKTTNAIESVMARVEDKTARVDHWRTSDQKLRWCAAALLAAEAQFRRVKGHDKLPLLKRALEKRGSTIRQDAA